MENANIGLGIYEVLLLAVIFMAVAWTLVWKGIALWHAARDGQKGWFVALLVINTLGVLEILYLFVFRARPAAGAPGSEPIGPR